MIIKKKKITSLIILAQGEPSSRNDQKLFNTDEIIRNCLIRCKHKYQM